MINKEERNKILSIYVRKEEKIFVASLIDNINKSETRNIVTHTSFLDLREKSIAISVLERFKVKYHVFNLIEDIEKTVIFLIPEYMDKADLSTLFKEYISVLKIVPNVKGMLKHKDYMGAIYSLGIKENMIGDIFLCDDIAYVFLLKSAAKFFLDNLLYVARCNVKLEEVDIMSDEVKKLHLNFKNLEVMVTSTRVDAVLASVYNLSRNEVKSKIEAGDLYINSKEMFFTAQQVSRGDIISFRKCGKIKIGSTVRVSRSGKIVLGIQKYI